MIKCPVVSDSDTHAHPPTLTHPHDQTPQTRYEQGNGVPRNYHEARQLYALASAQGDAEAGRKMKGLDGKIAEEWTLGIKNALQVELSGTGTPASSRSRDHVVKW